MAFFSEPKSYRKLPTLTATLRYPYYNLRNNCSHPHPIKEASSEMTECLKCRLRITKLHVLAHLSFLKTTYDKTVCALRCTVWWANTSFPWMTQSLILVPWTTAYTLANTLLPFTFNPLPGTSTMDVRLLGTSGKYIKHLEYKWEHLDKSLKDQTDTSSLDYTYISDFMACLYSSSS